MRHPVRATLERLRERGRLRRARRLDPDTCHELHQLCRLGLVEVEAKGLPFEQIEVLIESRTDLALRVSIPSGTSFRSGGEQQSVVVRRELRLDLDPRSLVQVYLPFCALDAFRRSPTDGDAFPRVVPAPEPVRRFLERSEGLHAPAVQAGIWALGEGCSRASLRRRVLHDGGHGPRLAAISHEELDAAEALLDRLGLQHDLRATRGDQLDRIRELVRRRGREGEAVAWALRVASQDRERHGPRHPDSIESQGLAVRVMAWARRVEDAVEAGRVLERALLESGGAEHREGVHYLAAAALDLLALQATAGGPDGRVLIAVESWLATALTSLTRAGEADGSAGQVYREGIRRARRMRGADPSGHSRAGPRMPR